MTRVAFLLDEHMPTFIKDAVLARESSVDIVQIGVDPGMPPKGTLDPEVLLFAESNAFAVVTFDKQTMPDFAHQHVAIGRHTWGVFVFPNGNDLSARTIADELMTIWGASEAHEWIDQVKYLPLRP